MSETCKNIEDLKNENDEGIWFHFCIFLPPIFLSRKRKVQPKDIKYQK